MKKKKILFLSLNDWANSGFRYTEALNRYSEKYECKYFCVNEHPFMYKRDNVFIDKESGLLKNEIVNDFREYAKDCDVIHCKENSGFIAGFEDVAFDLNKPIVQTFGGSVYRAHHTEIREKTDPIVNVHTVTTPDLQFSDEVFIPFAIDTDKYFPIKKSDDCIIIGHSPTNKEIKGTDIILDILSSICSKYPDVFVNVQNGLKFYYAIELKRINHIFIDQFRVNAYGNSAVEAMAFGSAVLAGTDSGAQGVINFNEDSLYDELDRLIGYKEYLEDRQKESLNHCIDTHSYKVVSGKLDKVYDLALERGGSK